MTVFPFGPKLFKTKKFCWNFFCPLILLDFWSWVEGSCSSAYSWVHPWYSQPSTQNEQISHWKIQLVPLHVYRCSALLLKEAVSTTYFLVSQSVQRTGKAVESRSEREIRVRQGRADQVHCVS